MFSVLHDTHSLRSRVRLMTDVKRHLEPYLFCSNSTKQQVVRCCHIWNTQYEFHVVADAACACHHSLITGRQTGGKPSTAR